MTALRIAAAAGVVGMAAAADPVVGSSDLGPVRRIAGGPYEGSGAVLAPGGKGILFVDDGRSDAILWIQLAGDGVTGAGTSRLVRWDGHGSAVRVMATLPDDLAWYRRECSAVPRITAG